MIRKKVAFFLLTVLISTSVLIAQDTDVQKIFSNTQGIIQDEATFYEVEGYSISVQILKATFDDKSINKIKRKYSIQSDIQANTDTAFPTNKMFISIDNKTPQVIHCNIYYFFPDGQNEIKIIGLQTTTWRDEKLEKLFVKSILDSSIPNKVYVPITIDSIKFAGRNIALGPACRWMEPHNVQCPNLGQMNWSEFRSFEKAKEKLQAQHDISVNKKLGEVLEEQEVDIVFEGKETKALKTKYKIKIPKLIMGGSNVLIVYYVATKVRGKYVACVLSHYTNDVNGTTLPPLLSEVMKLKE